MPAGSGDATLLRWLSHAQLPPPKYAIMAKSSVAMAMFATLRSGRVLIRRGEAAATEPWSGDIAMRRTRIGAALLVAACAMEGCVAQSQMPQAALESHSPYTLANPEGPLNDYYKPVGLSDDLGDCNKGCAAGGGRF